jgi:hypothetical protein
MAGTLPTSRFPWRAENCDLHHIIADVEPLRSIASFRHPTFEGMRP